MTSEPTERPDAGTDAEKSLVDEAERSLVDEAERAFGAGQFARVRELGARLSRSSDPELVKTGRELVQKVSADPLAIALFVASAVFFALVVNHYVL